jgi:hypothetical protein
MDKKQFNETYKPKQSMHKNGHALITTFQKDNDGKYPLHTELKKHYPKGFFEFNNGGK